MPDKRQKSYKRSKSRSKKSKKGTRKRTTNKFRHRKRSRNIMRGGVNMVSFDELEYALNKNRAGKNAMTDFIEKYAIIISKNITKFEEFRKHYITTNNNTDKIDIDKLWIEFSLDDSSKGTDSSYQRLITAFNSLRVQPQPTPSTPELPSTTTATAVLVPSAPNISPEPNLQSTTTDQPVKNIHRVRVPMNLPIPPNSDDEQLRIQNRKMQNRFDIQEASNPNNQ